MYSIMENEEFNAVPEFQCCYSVSPHVCFIVVLILISVFLR